jgi:hypothetical protein
MKRTTAPRILLALAITTMILTGVGFILTLILNAFVLDKYNAYGEVPIPGEKSLHLPAGEVTISFHTQIIGSGGGGGLPVPNLKMNIEPPPGVVDPVVTENFGTTTTVNSDSRVRVWVAQIPQEGTYKIATDGNVSAFVSPRLAFGHNSAYGTLPWILAGIFVFATLDLIIALIWLARARRRPVPAAPLYEGPTVFTPRVAESYTPNDDGVRIEQLKTLAALRDSGALTDAEFESEKRRLLDGR